jgi:HNH endonuclease
MAHGTCSEDDCCDPHYARGYCNRHYQQARKLGELPPPPRTTRHCDVNGCNNVHRCCGYCNKHYHRYRLYGDPLGTPPPRKRRPRRGRVTGAGTACRVDGCETHVACRQFCERHYKAWRKYGDPLGAFAPKQGCAVDDCEQPHHAHGLCARHCTAARRLRQPACEVDGCDQRQDSRGLCGPHYNLVWRTENPARYRENAAKGAQIRRARKRGARVEPFRATGIYERDGWKCGICGERVSKRLVHPHPRSASIDHIVPLSQGGEHSPANVQMAHLRCNLRKGDRHGGQLRLIG